MNARSDPSALAAAKAAGANQTPQKPLHLVAPETGGQGGAVHVPKASLLTQGDYARLGPDLLITGPDGEQVLIQDYFLTDAPPSLVSDDGAQISGDLAEKLAGAMAPGQFAQAGAGGSARQSIGQIETLNGAVNVVHADGTKGVLHKGDAVYQGDVLQTGKASAIGVVFLDKTSLSLGGDGRMVLDQMVYDPSSGSGKSAFSLVQGTFSFVSGQISKSAPDAMMVRTPVATIGIRGTLGTAGYTPEKGLTAALLPEGANGTVVAGEMTISNQGGTQTINVANFVTQVLTFFTAPPPAISISASQIQTYFGQTLQNLPPPPSNPAALQAVQQMQQQAQAQGFQAGLQASQAGTAAGLQNGDIKVQQTAPADQVAKDKVAQLAINTMISAGKTLNAAQDSGKEIKAGIDRAVSEGKSLDDIARDVAKEIVRELGLGDNQLNGDNNAGQMVGHFLQTTGQGDGAPRVDGGRALGDLARESGNALRDQIQQQIAREITRVVEAVSGANQVVTTQNYTVLFDDYAYGTTANDTLTGGTGNTNFIFDYSQLGGFDTVNDSGATGQDRLTFTNMVNMRIEMYDPTSGDGKVLGVGYSGFGSSTSVSEITISTAIDDIQASAGGLADGIILTDAMASGKLVNTSNHGYIVVGTLLGGDTIDESGYLSPMGSIVFGLGGADIITGTSGNDAIYGGLGGDTLFGKAGNDKLFGDAGDDLIYSDFDASGVGGYANDAIDGGLGTDTLNYSTISGNIVVDISTTSGYSSTSTYTDSITNIENIYTGSGSDTIIGDSGANTLIGWLGSDSLTGNGGADVFAFRLGNGSTINPTSDSTSLDRITDLVFGTDKFLLLDSPSTGASLSAVPLASITYAYNAGTLSTGTLAGDITSIFADRDGAGVGTGGMTANDFVFFTSSSDSHTYLAVESGFTAGYQSNQDIFIDVTGVSGLSAGTLTKTDVVSNT
ncbi:MAG: hypothetical protein EPN26_11580 [Rhodospirillales bacterium]|nr:MAG: hypothetical protein EPN26_11580 [Rhodospirillales bacterium]